MSGILRVSRVIGTLEFSVGAVSSLNGAHGESFGTTNVYVAWGTSGDA